jgi:hypothetical protein
LYHDTWSDWYAKGGQHVLEHLLLHTGSAPHRLASEPAARGELVDPLLSLIPEEDARFQFEAGIFISWPRSSLAQLTIALQPLGLSTGAQQTCRFIHGVIRTRDILAHPVVTVRCFGWRIFFRALFTSRRQTLLSLLQNDNYFQASTPNVPAILDRCVGLELQAAEIYRNLAQRFPEDSPHRIFLSELAEQERYHADLLQLCRAATVRGRWDDSTFRPWAERVPGLEEQLSEVRKALESAPDHDQPVQVVAGIESSEINQVLLGVIKATDSEFVRRLAPFRRCVEDHIAFICQWLPRLGQGGMLASRELRAKFIR